MKLIGLDFETTGPETADLPIEVGLAIYDNGEWKRFSELITWESEDLVPVWDDEIAKIHGIDIREVLQFDSSQSPQVWDVDQAAWNWLQRFTGEPVIAVGWNIGQFDMQILRKWMPRTYHRFFYRLVDLTSIARFGLDLDDAGVEHLKSVVDSELASRGFEPRRHRAGYDALASLVELDYLRNWIMLGLGWTKESVLA